MKYSIFYPIIDSYDYWQIGLIKIAKNFKSIDLDVYLFMGELRLPSQNSISLHGLECNRDALHFCNKGLN